MATAHGSTSAGATELTTAAAVDVIHQTTGSSMTSSSSRDVGFYFQCAVVVIAVVGAAANGLVLYAMVASKQHKKQVLIFSQNLLDFVSCLFLCAAYSARLGNVQSSGTRGYGLCVIALVEGFSCGPEICRSGHLPAGNMLPTLGVYLALGLGFRVRVRVTVSV